MPEISEMIYECVRCHHRAPISEWERGGPAEFKCPMCSYRVAKKMRPPLVKQVKCV